MNPSPEPQQQFLTIRVDTSHPQLLNALEAWLQLGIITQNQVRFLSERYLSCDFTPAPEIPAATRPQPSDFAVASPMVAPPPLRVSPLQEFWLAFKDEISVRWLLFLGLFLVVISSGVLAATQWQKVSSLGQYLILFSYTLIAGAVGFWADRQERLSITSQSLRVLTILLIPINFWAMDSLKLSQSPSGLILGGLAASILISIYAFYSQSRLLSPLFLLFTGFSLMQWGWQFPLFPFRAIYTGLISFFLYLLYARWKSPNISGFNQPTLFSLYGISVLLLRGLFVNYLPWQNFILSLGIYGWIIQYISASSSSTNKLNRLLENIGIAILILSWLTSIYYSHAWVNILLSSLLLQGLWRRLKEENRIIDLLLMFIIGLISYDQLPRLLPVTIRESINTYINELLTGSSSLNYALYAITLFPYLWLWRGISKKLYQQKKRQLARIAMVITVFLGTALTALSLGNPRSRSLNLLLTALTLAYTTYTILPLRIVLVYTSHILSVITLVSAMDWLFSPQSTFVWAEIFLSIGIVQWGVSLLANSNPRLNFAQAWYRSSWHLGFLSAAIAYLLLLAHTIPFRDTIQPQFSVLMWFSVTLALTAIGYYRRRDGRRVAIIASTVSLLLAQILTFFIPTTRIISLAISAVFLLINSICLPQLWLSRLQVLFTTLCGLIWTAEHLQGGNLSVAIFSQPTWILAQGLGLAILWLLYLWLRRYDTTLLNLYRQAADEVAILLCGLTLAQLSINIGSHLTYQFPTNHIWGTTCLLMAGSIMGRSWHSLNNLSIYAMVLALELFIIEIAQNNLVIATYNILLGLFLVAIIPWLTKKFPWVGEASALRILPLGLAVLGMLWRLDYLTPHTGWLTLGAAGISWGVSYQVSWRRLLSSISVVTFSLGIYEWVIYRLLQVRGGDFLPGLLVLSLVAVGLGCVYRLTVWLWQRQGYSSLGAILLSDLKAIANLHWIVGSLFKLSGFVYSLVVFGIFTTEITLQPTLTLLLLTLLLSVYAFLQSRSSGGGAWVYAGFGDSIITVIVARLLWEQLAFLDPFYGVMVGVIALGIYYAPWPMWGWNIRPWRRVALTLPLGTSLLTCGVISDLSLILLAAFYIQVGISRHNLRWTYFSLGFMNWLVLRFLYEANWQDNMMVALVVGLSILYIPQVDPVLRQPGQRSARHCWRMVGSSVINGTALVFYQATGLIPAVAGMLTLLSGLGLKVRAFLYVGTMTFILTGLYQLVVLNFRYSFAKWVIGLVVGIIFMVVAANFEQRREQLQRLWQNCLDELGRWE